VSGGAAPARRAARVAVIPGDGIGPEVIAEGVKALTAACARGGVDLALTHLDFGAERYLRTGETLPEADRDRLGRDFDALYLGAVGDPRVPDQRHAFDILFGLRFGLDLYANVRPVKLLDARLTPLRDRGPADVDFVLVRENTEGLYAHVGGFFKRHTADETAVQLDVNTHRGVERILTYAFDLARRAGRRTVVMADKSNALTYGHDLWQRLFRAVAARYPDITARHLYVDALTALMVQRPQELEVVVTCNMFGDILGDLGAALQGGLGLAPSANLRPGAPGLFEPVHGSAPALAGRGHANPYGAILTAALLCDDLGLAAEAALLERAVTHVLRAGVLPRDLGGDAGTAACGDAVAAAVATLPAA
jgi:3-isopropylmalate dehydrogenase